MTSGCPYQLRFSDTTSGSVSNQMCTPWHPACHLTTEVATGSFTGQSRAHSSWFQRLMAHFWCAQTMVMRGTCQRRPSGSLPVCMSTAMPLSHKSGSYSIPVPISFTCSGITPRDTQRPWLFLRRLTDMKAILILVAEELVGLLVAAIAQKLSKRRNRP